ncbi:hypothetical protein AB0M44_17375 [Streptosporangium subroseum]
MDDLLKASPDLGPWRPRIGLVPKLSDAELVALAMMQVLLGFTSEARRLRHAQPGRHRLQRFTDLVGRRPRTYRSPHRR